MVHILLSLFNGLAIWKFRRYVLSQEKAGMYLGNNVMICPGVKFDPPHSFLTSIGDNCIIAPDVRFLNHDASLFGFTKCAIIGKIVIQENCFVGAGATLLPGITIGPNVIVGANSIVTDNIESDSIVVGNPAKQIGKTSEYIEKHKSHKVNKKFPMFNSDVFYRKIFELNYRTEVKEKMINGLAYTIGEDHDYNFIFNRTDN